jgi:hypothetical protein
MFVAAKLVVWAIVTVAVVFVPVMDTPVGAADPSLFLINHVIPVPPLVWETVNVWAVVVVSRFWVPGVVRTGLMFAVTLNVLDDDPILFPPVTVMLDAANMLFTATAMINWVFEVLEVEAPVGYTGVFHVSAGLVPPLFVTVIVLAVVVSRNSVPGSDNDGGFPAVTLNVREAGAPAPFVAVTVMLNAGVIVIPWATEKLSPPTVPAVVATTEYVIPYVRSVAALGDVDHVIWFGPESTVCLTLNVWAVVAVLRDWSATELMIGSAGA